MRRNDRWADLRKDSRKRMALRKKNMSFPGGLRLRTCRFITEYRGLQRRVLLFVEFLALKRRRRVPYQPGVQPQVNAAPAIAIRAESPRHRHSEHDLPGLSISSSTMDRAFSPALRWDSLTWDFAPGWYGAGPLALSGRSNKHSRIGNRSALVDVFERKYRRSSPVFRDEPTCLEEVASRGKLDAQTSLNVPPVPRLLTGRGD